METTISFNISEYLTDLEIKELVKDQARAEIQKLFRNEENAQRILSNLSYKIVFDEVDKIIPNSIDVIAKKTLEIVDKQDYGYLVFRKKDGYNTNSFAYDVIEKTVIQHQARIQEKTADAIINADYSEKILDKFMGVAENFMSNIYDLIDLAKKRFDKK